MFLCRENRWKLGWLLLLVFSFPFVYGQSYNFINYTTDDGLPSNEVHCSYQQADGSMLFGTDVGLVHFNGNSFVSIPFTESQKTNSTIFNIVKGANNRLYISTYRNGLFYLDGDSVRPYIHNSKLLKLCGQTFIANLIVTQRNELFFSLHSLYDYRIYNLDSNGNEKVIEPKGVYKEFGKKARKYLFVKEDTLAISKSTGIEKFKYSNHERHPEFWDDSYNEHDNLSRDNSDFKYLKLPESEFKVDYSKGQKEISLFFDGCWWVSYEARLAIFDTDGNLISFYDVASKIQHIAAKGKGTVIVSYETGASIISFENGLFKEEIIAQNELITWGLQDNEGGVWLTSTKNGIYYAPSLKVKVFRGISSEDQDILNVETNPNEFVIINRKGEVILYSFPDFELRYFPSYIRTTNKVLLSEGLLQTNNWQVSFDSSYSMRERAVHTLGSNDIYQYPNSDTLLLASARYGVHVTHKNDDTNFETTKKYDRKLKTYAIHVLDNTIYIGTDNGIQIFSKSNIDYKPYEAERINTRIQDLQSIGHKLIASSNMGLFICEKDRVLHITQKDGLVSNICRKIEVQNDSTFWVANKYGLNQIIYDSKSGKYRIFTFSKDDGLVSNSVNDLAIEGDHLFMATNKGLCIGKVEDLKINRSFIPFQINIPSLKINEFDFTDTLFIPKAKRDIYLLIKEMSFHHNEYLSYSFVLNNENKNQVVSSNNSISYANLKPGYNSITLNMASANKVWNAKPITLHIWAERHFFEQLWFKILASTSILLGIGLSFFIVFKIRERRQRQQLDVAIANQEATVAKYKTLSLQLSPHFIFNSLNNIQYLSVTKDYVSVNQFVARLARLTRNILEHSKEQLIPLQTEIENLKMYLEIEQIRFEHKPIDLLFEIDPELELKNFSIPPMILQPSVENAIWHGLLNKDGSRKLEITFKTFNRGFEVYIKDNGIGLNTKQKGKIQIKGQTSIGVKNTKDRIQLYNEMNLGLAVFTLEELREGDDVLGTIAFFKFDQK